MAQYTQEQLQVIRTIRRVARRRYADNPGKRKRYEMTAYTIGRVEANFTNPSGGDADSVGWRQERASIYGGDMNIGRSVNRVFDEMEQHDRGQKIGELAADVQRPAAQYRSRYADHLAEARRLAGKGGGVAAGRAQLSGGMGHVRPGRPPKLVPGSTTVDKRSALVDALVAGGDGSLIKRWQGNIASGQYTTTTPPKVVKGKPAKYESLGTVTVKGGAPQGKGTIHELFWNGENAVNIDEGKRVGKGFVSGHTDHVHLAADHATMKRAARLAKSLGLGVGGYGKGIVSGHADNSFHYQPFGAMDVSGDVGKMAEFARRVARGEF